MYTIASLSEKAWIDDPKAILSYVMSCYLLTDAAQTYVFQNNVKSLPQTYHRFINDPSGMATAVRSELSEMLGYYFAHAEVSTQVREISVKHYAIALHAVVLTEDGARHNLAKVMELDSQNLRKILDVNNYGNALSVLQSL